MSDAQAGATRIRSLVPARLDRLPWTSFHWMVIVGLGACWILDGLEITLVGNANPVLQSVFHVDAAQTGLLATFYLVGQVVGALVFGRLTDQLGRKRLFILTLVLYLIASGISGLAPSLWFMLIFRFFAGMGIGGEYTAINSAIDELIPSKFRGRVDIAINSTYWAGAMIGSIVAPQLLNTSFFAQNLGWRLGFFIGPIIGLGVIFIRRGIPESPRWLITHGRAEDAEATTTDIEHRVERSGAHLDPVPDSRAIVLTGGGEAPFAQIVHTLLVKYPSRSILCVVLFVTQSFLYNAIFFNDAGILHTWYGVPVDKTGYYFFPFAACNLLGGILLGGLFDTWGRRRMIGGTYIISGAILLISGLFFAADSLDAITQTLFWMACFFFATAGASAAYLTCSEIFPVELRGSAISVFFSVGQLIGGAVAPPIFGALMGATARGPLTIGFVLGGGLMIVGGLVELLIGVDAERKSLEDIATPLTALEMPASVSG
ncbi:MAG TPA: MFS transporter [Candidatus Dormibacteraeota bacterium]|nr:MFS transporter [Candidatus Dormibacteraeota bacterium]